MEGQLDFLGIISEYTDNQGAIVRIREPKSRPAIKTGKETVKLSDEIENQKPNRRKNRKPNRRKY